MASDFFIESVMIQKFVTWYHMYIWAHYCNIPFSAASVQSPDTAM